MLPLMWKKGSIWLNHFRIRWILKKSRFQVTIMCTGQNNEISINKQKVLAQKGIRKILYLENLKMAPQLGLTILNSSGGKYFCQNIDHQRELIVNGSLLTENGIFADHYLL